MLKCSECDPKTVIATIAMLCSCLATPPFSCQDVITANAGDSRAVMCRAGKALELSYDHKQLGLERPTSHHLLCLQEGDCSQVPSTQS